MKPEISEEIARVLSNATDPHDLPKMIYRADIYIYCLMTKMADGHKAIVEVLDKGGNHIETWHLPMGNWLAVLVTFSSFIEKHKVDEKLVFWDTAVLVWRA